MSDIVERLRMMIVAGMSAAYRPHIEEAAAEIARLREERRWISVGERLPVGQSDDVLTARGPWEDGAYSVGIGWWNGECWMSYNCNSERDMPPVAFWRPLPPGPEGDG